MKAESIVLAVAGMCFGVIVGWLLANVEADRNAARAVVSQPAPQPAQAGNERQPRRLDEARVQSLTTILESEPKNAGAAVQLGTTYFEAEQFDNALKWYQEALRIEPKNQEAMAQVGLTYFFTRGPDPALAALDQSLAINPNHPQTLLNKGIVLWQGKNDLSGAADVWRTLVKAAPESPQARMAQQGLDAIGARGQGDGAKAPATAQ